MPVRAGHKGDRALIDVAGPAGTSKTALIEAMAAESDASVLVARCLGDDTSARPPGRRRPGRIPRFATTNKGFCFDECLRNVPNNRQRPAWSTRR